jgi:hypothetical protein
MEDLKLLSLNLQIDSPIQTIILFQLGIFTGWNVYVCASYRWSLLKIINICDETLDVWICIGKPK